LIAVVTLAPMTNASVTTAVSVKPGCFSNKRAP
jgi:hypothetical protein